MVQGIRDFLADEERAPSVLIGGSVAILVVGLVVALAAMYG